jgi:hypothetical protein
MMMPVSAKDPIILAIIINKRWNGVNRNRISNIEIVPAIGMVYFQNLFSLTMSFTMIKKTIMLRDKIFNVKMENGLAGLGLPLNPFCSIKSQ